MRATLSSDVYINAPAKAIWSAYCDYPLMNKLLVDIIGTTELLDGDKPAPGRRTKTVVPTGIHGPGYFMNRYTIHDSVKMVKEKETIEGGPLPLGYDKFKMRFEVFEKGECEAMVTSTIEYEIKDYAAVVDEMAGLNTIKALDMMAKVLGEHAAKESTA